MNVSLYNLLYSTNTEHKKWCVYIYMQWMYLILQRALGVIHYVYYTVLRLMNQRQSVNAKAWKSYWLHQFNGFLGSSFSYKVLATVIVCSSWIQFFLFYIKSIKNLQLYFISVLIPVDFVNLVSKAKSNYVHFYQSSFILWIHSRANDILFRILLTLDTLYNNKTCQCCMYVLIIALLLYRPVEAHTWGAPRSQQPHGDSGSHQEYTSVSGYRVQCSFPHSCGNMYHIHGNFQGTEIL